MSEYVLGQVFLRMARGEGPKSLPVLIRNIGFLLKYMPFAGKRAEKHLNTVIKVAEEIGAKQFLGQACLDLGLLYKKKGKTDQARQYLGKAVKVFEGSEAEHFLRQAKDALASLR